MKLFDLLLRLHLVFQKLPLSTLELDHSDLWVSGGCFHCVGCLGLLELLRLNLLYATQIRVSLVFGFISLYLAFYGVAAFGQSRQLPLYALRGLSARACSLRHRQQ